VKFIHMLKMYIKKFSVAFLIVSLLFSGFDPAGFVVLYKNILVNKGGVVDKIYLASKNKNVVDVFFNKTEVAHAAINSAEKEYVIDIGPVSGSTTANYVYASFFNPLGSGRTASIKRIAIRSNTASSTASNYVNLTLRRISAASAGTSISATDIPKKNASSSDSVVEIRYGGATTTLTGTVDSRILGQPLSGAVGAYYSLRDITFESGDEKLVIQPGEGVAVYQEAAGVRSTAVRVLIEWDETANAPPGGDEFLFAFPRVENAAGVNYVYNSFFNPSSSGKTAVVRRIWFGSETCDAAAVYTNNIVLKRISAASGGTAVTASNVPKKNTSSANSVMEFRHTNVTATTTGGADARIGHVTPCGAAAQAHGWKQINFDTGDEELILQQGEGVALMSEAAGNANQIVRMIIEWDEVPSDSTPSSQGGYIWSSGKVASSTALNATMYSFFNPVGSGKTAVIKRLAIRANATTTAAYTSFQFRRITAASGGTLVAAADLPKLHTGTSDSVMEARWCLQGCNSIISATYAGTADAKLLSVTGAGAVGQLIGQTEIVFGQNEKLILQPGEGIALYNDVLVSSVAETVKITIEWDEEVSAPSSQGEYLMTIGPVNGNTATTYNYMSFFNPVSSGKTAVIKRVGIKVNTINAAVYVPIQLRRITSSSGGTVVASSSYPKKHTGTATSSMEIRTTGSIVTYAGATTSRLLAIQTPGAVASAAAGNTGEYEILFNDSEPLVLQPGEGVVLYQNPTAGDVDFRVRMLVEWAEQASSPTSQNEYMMAIGPINQALTANYVYATLFNPANSAKNYILRKIGIRSDRSGAATVPAYTPITIRRISAASGGTLTATTSLSKNTSSPASTAEVRSTGVTATFVGVADSRLLGATISGLVNLLFGDYSSKITPGDELILKPGEGVALYQEQAAGDANVRHHFILEWDEEGTSTPAQSISFTISTSTVFFGTVSPSIARYASSTNPQGSNTEVEAHSFSVLTNATNGYTVSAKGQTLTSGTTTIAAIGAVATTSLVGTEQFGIRITAASGSGTSTSPYNTSAFAYAATATTSSQVANATVGDNATTTFSVRYIANISPTTKAASYTANIIYVVTANF
jgi:nicotinamide riboside kinase